MPEYAAKGRFHKGGGNSGLRAMGIARLVSLPGVGSSDKPKQVCQHGSILPLWTCVCKIASIAWLLPLPPLHAQAALPFM